MFRLLRKGKWGRRDFEMLMRNISEGIVVQKEGGKIVYANQAAVEIFKLKSPAGLVGKKFDSVLKKYIISDEKGRKYTFSKSSLFKFFGKKKEHKDILNFKKVKDERGFWLRLRTTYIPSDEGDIVYVATSIRDITKTRENEEELLFRKKLLESLGEATTQGVLAVDKNQRIIYVNARLAQILSVELRDLGETVEELFEVGKNNILEFDKFSRKALIVGKSKTRKARGMFQTKNAKFISYYTVPLTEANSNFLARVWFFEDKTYAIKTEQEREVFISIATHELKNPITTVRGYLELIIRKIEQLDKESTKKYLLKVLEQTDKVTELINDLMDITQIRSGAMILKHSQFDINSVVNEVTEEFKKSTGRRVWRSGSAKLPVYADQARIRQVIVNLISNAIKYSGENTSIKVAIKQDTQNTTVSVKDEGPGIRESEKVRIFDVFVRGKDKNRSIGHGIGLFLSQAIIGGHNGKIWVESKYGHGATFSFSIPNNPTNSRTIAKIFRI